jgi:WD40 repeat protein
MRIGQTQVGGAGRPSTGVCEAVLEGHTSYVSALAVLPDGRLASGSADTTVRVWS